MVSAAQMSDTIMVNSSKRSLYNWQIWMTSTSELYFLESSIIQANLESQTGVKTVQDHRAWKEVSLLHLQLDQGAITHPPLHPFVDPVTPFLYALPGERAITLLSIKNGAMWENFSLKNLWNREDWLSTSCQAYFVSMALLNFWSSLNPIPP